VNSEFVEGPVVKNLITVGAAMMYAGISDIEFLKASALVFVASRMT
jgi:hypothetical protein